uniref:Uncharacterized protein n=1 Tax=Oryza rufipogon TaxID=4529 RepID=A0A0E0Q1W3_ORYRU
MKALRVSRNVMDGQVSPEIGNLKQLEFFSLTINSFVNISGMFWNLKGCTSLTALLVSYNFYGEALPDAGWRKQNKMERSSSKPVIALVLLVVCIVSCFEVVTAQYDGSSSNGAAATGPMAAGGNCSLVVAAACLSGTETLRWKRCDRLMRALRLSPSWAREAEEKLAAAGASNGCLPVDGRVVAANEKVRRRRRVVVGVADAGCGLHGTAAASRLARRFSSFATLPPQTMPVSYPVGNLVGAREGNYRCIAKILSRGHNSCSSSRQRERNRREEEGEGG